MKKMNKSIKFLTMAFSIAVASVLISCGEDDDPIIIDEDPVVADGFYVIGTSTSEVISADVELQLYSVDQADGVPTMRDGFYGNFYYLSAGSLNFVFYSNNVPVTYGGTVEEVLYNNDDFSYSKGALTENGQAVSISEAGFYQIHVDLTTELFFVTKVEYFEIIGDVTPGGWSSGTELTMKSGASASQVVFEGTNIALRQGADGFKFRYNSNWTNNVDVDGDNIAMQTNLGVDGFAGGANTPFDGTDGVYTITLTFTPGEVDWTLTRTGDVEALPYLDNAFMIGATIGGWDWAANGIQMIPVNGQPHLFWRIVWMDADATDPGFKFSPQADWGGDFGVSGDATDGVYAKGSDNVPGPTTSGYYMVVLNLETETIEVNEPLVYGIGDAFGAWDASTPAYQFTVDNANSVIKFDAVPATAAELRIHVAASTMKVIGGANAIEWWQSEFIVLNGVIEYRGKGGDQARAAVTAGQSVSLNFKDGTGSIQ